MSAEMEGRRNKERFKEMEKDKAQITLAVTRVIGERRNPSAYGCCYQDDLPTNFYFICP